MNVLAVFAHPDDEVLACGGTLARHVVSDGDQVVVKVFTNGVGSRLGATGRDIATRDREARAAWKALGVVGYASDLGDQLLDTVPVSAIALEVAELVRTTEADVVYTHWPGDLNQDHRAVAQAVLIATRTFASSVREVYACEVPESTSQAFGQVPFAPNTYVNITSTIDMKGAALDAYASERRQPPHPRSVAMMRAHAAVRGAESGLAYAEAFQLLRQVVR